MSLFDNKWKSEAYSCCRTADPFESHTAAAIFISSKFIGQVSYQVSTDEVYGDFPLDRPNLFFTEEMPLHTSSPYAGGDWDGIKRQGSVSSSCDALPFVV